MPLSLCPIGAQPHTWIPSLLFHRCSSPCPWNHTRETGHLPGWCWLFEMQNSRQYPREPHLEGLILLLGAETQLWQWEGASKGWNSQELSGMASAWTSSGSVPGHHLQHRLPRSGAAANWNPPGNSGNAPQQQPQSEKFGFSSSEALKLNPGEGSSGTSPVLPAGR